MYIAICKLVSMVYVFAVDKSYLIEGWHQKPKYKSCLDVSSTVGGYF